MYRARLAQTSHCLLLYVRSFGIMLMQHCVACDEPCYTCIIHYLFADAYWIDRIAPLCIEYICTQAIVMCFHLQVSSSTYRLFFPTKRQELATSFIA